VSLLGWMLSIATSLASPALSHFVLGRLPSGSLHRQERRYSIDIMRNTDLKTVPDDGSTIV